MRPCQGRDGSSILPTRTNRKRPKGLFLVRVGRIESRTEVAMSPCDGDEGGGVAGEPHGGETCDRFSLADCALSLLDNIMSKSNTTHILGHFTPLPDLGY